MTIENGQAWLVATMREYELSADQIAFLAGVSKRKVNSWIADPSSSEFVRISDISIAWIKHEMASHRALLEKRIAWDPKKVKAAARKLSESIL